MILTRLKLPSLPKSPTFPFAFRFSTSPPHHHLQQQPPITNKPYWTNKIHNLCTKHRNVDEALRLLDTLCLHGYHPDSLNLSSIIHALCDCNRFSEAHHRFLLFLSSHLVPDERTCNVLIARLLYSKTPLSTFHVIRSLLKRDYAYAMELMNKLWERMKDVKDDPAVNAAAFANLIDCLCREGYFNEVFRIVESMPQGKSVSEEFAYGHMIDSLCRAGRNHGASRVVYLMRKKGFVPSLVSYNCIIHGLCKEGGCMRAYQLFEDGFEFGYLPSEYTYKVLVEGLCRESDFHKGRQVLHFMLNKKGADRIRIYNIYLRALCLVNNNPTEFLNVLVSMLQNQCQPDVITLNTVINGFCKMGRIEDALQVLSDMINGKFCAPDVVTFTTVACGLLDVGRTQEALDVLNQIMPERGLRPGVITYNAVLRGLFKTQHADEAMGVFNCMVNEGVTANCTTYAIVVDGLCQYGQIEEAKKFWDDVIWPSQIHDDFVYAAILKGQCQASNFNLACHFLYELVDSGVTPNTVSYNIVINKACKLGLEKEAYQIVGEMRKNGLEPDAVTWRILEKLHGDVRKTFCTDDSLLKS
ncbi:pentatricopeptide repeat-containing protein At3g18020 isoform X3 [Durio zibethinus]|uniref:Pentatricopeptide repeat-containing protein At3g18020 isoform X3 n=1 Tax=Durio zibethinus TaxID=66656 RepID=A0A6P5Y991_DURZI|nr:pentatricopeptide repeat-containing protein At3g18020 isoform X3 [Durio zibethinus]